MLGPILDTIRASTDPHVLQALVQGAGTLANNSELAEAVLGPILNAIDRASTNPDAMGLLAQVMKVLSPTPKQAEAALGPVLDAIRVSTNRDLCVRAPRELVAAV
jgi:hypothetical protein